MTKKLKLSPTMIAVIDVAMAHGGELECWKGGFWTYPGCRVVKTDMGFNGPYDVPEWYADTNTLQALARRGRTEVTKRTATGFPIGVRILPAAE